jgi:ribosomal protein S14
MQGVGEKEEATVKGFIRVTESCAVTGRERGVVERI